MAAEVENMFSVRQTPWHGLGNVLPEAPSIKDAIQLAGLNWGVDTKPLFTAEGEKAPAVAIYRQDTGKILGVSGPRYKPFQNENAFEWFQPLVDSGSVTMETAGSLRGGKRVWVLGRINTIQEAMVATNDTVKAYVLLSNSHDGKVAIRTGFTGIRVVCSNTLKLAHNDSESKLIKVTHSNRAVENLQELRNAMDLAQREFSMTLDTYRFLATRGVDPKDLEKYVRVVFGLKSEEDQKREPKALIASLENFEKEISEGTAGSNWWNAYNSVQGYLQHQQGRTADTRMDNLWFGTAGARNQFALDTAIAFATAA